MIVLILISLIMVPISKQQLNNVTLKSQGALEYKTVELYKFKSIPIFAELVNDENRDIYHYEQTVVVRDYGLHNIVHRCEIIEIYKENEAKSVLQTLSSLLNLNILNVTMEKMMYLLSDCDSIDGNVKRTSNSREVAEKIAIELKLSNSIFDGIVPGTKWCGFGDIAKNYHDLGETRNVDRCCQAHDLCPIKVLGSDRRYNLFNKAFYTKSHCICDEAFYSCLKEDNGWTAKLIGKLYFYAVSPQCIKGLPEYPKEVMRFVSSTKKW